MVNNQHRQSFALFARLYKIIQSPKFIKITKHSHPSSDSATMFSIAYPPLGVFVRVKLLSELEVRLANLRLVLPAKQIKKGPSWVQNKPRIRIKKSHTNAREGLKLAYIRHTPNRIRKILILNDFETMQWHGETRKCVKDLKSRFTYSNSSLCYSRSWALAAPGGRRHHASTFVAAATTRSHNDIGPTFYHLWLLNSRFRVPDSENRDKNRVKLFNGGGGVSPARVGTSDTGSVTPSCLRDQPSSVPRCPPASPYTRALIVDL